MPTIEKTRGNREFVRDLGLFERGDRADVPAEQAARLCDGGNFERVSDDDDVDEGEDVDEVEVASDDSEDEEEEEPETEGDDSLAFDPNDHTVDDVRDHVRSIDSDDIVAELEAIREAEAAGKDRSTAIEAINARLEDVQED